MTGELEVDYKALVKDWRDSADFQDYNDQSGDSLRAAADAVEALLAEVAEMDETLGNFEAVVAERDALQVRLDAMTIEWGVALPGEPGFETPDRATAESFVRDYPEEEYSLVQRLVGPWTVVSERSDQ